MRVEDLAQAIRQADEAEKLLERAVYLAWRWFEGIEYEGYENEDERFEIEDAVNTLSNPLNEAIATLQEALKRRSEAEAG